MFKIVETVEKGSKQLTIVPSGWESKGELSWPKFRTDKLIKIADSMPEDSWFRMNCKLKRNHLINYDIAEEELERMCQNDDTELEESNTPVERRRRPRVLLPQKITAVHTEDFNNLANACMISEPVKKVNVISQEIIGFSEQSPQTTNIVDNVQSHSEEHFSTMNHNFSTTEHLEEKIQNLIDNQRIIIENQNIILQQFQDNACNHNQIILNQLAKFEAILDTFGNNMINISLSNDLQKEKRNDCVIEQIANLEDLEKLEHSLKEQVIWENLLESWSYVCGRKGNGNGTNNCYILVDRLFTRQFMTLCSWAGGARDNIPKIPFKIHKNVINLFFKVIQLSDAEFTLKDCEEFFKNVIRNSTRRNQSNLIRNSATKRRPKNLLYKKEEEIDVTKKNKDNREKSSEIEEDGEGENNNHKDYIADFEEDNTFTLI